MTEAQIETAYAKIARYHDKYLKSCGVKLPALRHGTNYTKDALVLVYLFQGYPNTRAVSKRELTQFLSNYFDDINDVQQARHLAAQKGFYILSGTRGDIADGLKPSEYKLKTLEKPYPGFSPVRRGQTLSDADWEELKRAYGYRCACCGSKEGERHLQWPGTITVLQKGHMDPTKPLTKSNTIPQCSKCNQPDRNNWVYDKRGRVVSVANASVIEKASLVVQRAIYEFLKRKFDK